MDHAHHTSTKNSATASWARLISAWTSCASLIPRGIGSTWSCRGSLYFIRRIEVTRRGPGIGLKPFNPAGGKQ